MPNLHDKAEHPPGEQLYASIRASLILKGTSFSMYCSDRGLCRVWMKDCIVGKRNGPKARKNRLSIARDVLGDAR